ncbi:SAM-dependent methyltransferase [Kitasatospora sp. RB6PN24]|uniref:SAM-dependent methyltransferase n=1 Tax=Kitasatospora humi TaxID=2893891 RepID=UPI001E324DDB|nr:SAM-dependent methyltransferase [Kitasatospora humi]MCC9305801.1 SAM-dependent methyltransferase [Kitasatospora humi]
MTADDAHSSEANDGFSINLDIHVPHSARMYDYYLGGVTNFPADREAAGRALAVFPYARAAARANRAFMHRSVRFLAQRGIDQFLDIGTGIPTSPNLHEVAQGVNPAARIVYADNDPIVLTHAEALLRSTPEGRTAYVQGDVREPEKVLTGAREVLDFSRPVGLSMNALLHFIADKPDRTAADLAEVFKSHLSPGSSLAISHFTPDFAAAEAQRLVQVYQSSGTDLQARTLAEVAALFDGWDLVEPGIVSTPRWRPNPESDGDPVTDAESSCYAGVAFRR